MKNKPYFTENKIRRTNCNFVIFLASLFSLILCSLQVTAQKEAYGVLSADRKTFTLYYDNKKSDRNVGGVTIINCQDEQGVYLENCCNDNTALTTVEFDASFADCYPDNCGFAFYNCVNLTTLKNTQYLNFNKVESTHKMFFQCKNLETLDLSTFESDEGISVDVFEMFGSCEKLVSLKLGSSTRRKIKLDKDATGMFHSCRSITDLDLSNLNTENVEYFSRMFMSCYNLKRINLSSFDLSGIKTTLCTQDMFADCESLEVLDLRSFNINRFNDWNGAFSETQDYGVERGCKKLTTIFVSEKWQLKPPAGTEWVHTVTFANCINLIGGNGFTYPYPVGYNINSDEEAQKIVSHYSAHIDQEGNPGFFTYAPEGEELEYKIFYKLGEGGVNNADNPSSFKETSSQITLKDPTRPGYIFLGWTGTIATKISATDPTKNVTIPKGSIGNRIYTANWIKSYTISFDTKGGSEIDPIVLKANDPVTAPDNPSKTGYNFVKWDKEIPATMPSEDVTITAQWKATEYNIELDYDGGKLPAGKSNPETYTIETATFSLANPEKEGFEFLGWSDGVSTLDFITIYQGSTGDIKFTAQWKELPGEEYYTITFLDQDGKTVLKSTKYVLNAQIAEYLPTKEGYDFKGWKEGALPKTMPDHDVTFTAQWEKQQQNNNITTTAIVAELQLDMDGKVSFPKDASKYCNGEENTVKIPYTVTAGKVSGYTVSFKDDVIPNIQATVKTDDEPNIVINIPSTLQSGVYQGSVVFSGDNKVYSNSEEYSFTLTVHLPEHLAVQVYTDVLVANNHDKRFESYQWYKNDSELPGATLQFYSEPKFSGSYKVKLTGKEGSVMSCPLVFGGTAKILAQSVSVYPNPARSGETFTIEIAEYDPTQIYDIVIFSANGSLVKKLSHVEKTTKVSLPFGVYSGSLINNGNKTGFKVIVK